MYFPHKGIETRSDHEQKRDRQRAGTENFNPESFHTQSYQCCLYDMLFFKNDLRIFNLYLLNSEGESESLFGF